MLFERGIFNTILKKIFLLVSRGRLLAVDNSNSQIQTIQISNFANETISDIERYQEYGFENYPNIPNSETITLFINGNRNATKGINIVVNNRGLRPTDLNKGDVCIYTNDSGKTNKNRIWLKPVNNEIEISTFDGNNIKIDNSGIVILDKNNNKIDMKNTGIEITDKNSNTIKMNGVNVDINGNSKKFVTYTELNAAITAFLIMIMAHVHTSAAPGSPTSIPTSPINFDISAAESQKARTG
jgi:phage baseplate assembly protein V